MKIKLSLVNMPLINRNYLPDIKFKKKISGIRGALNLSMCADSSTNIFIFIRHFFLWQNKWHRYTDKHCKLETESAQGADSVKIGEITCQKKEYNWKFPKKLNI